MGSRRSAAWGSRVRRAGVSLLVLWLGVGLGVSRGAVARPLPGPPQPADVGRWPWCGGVAACPVSEGEPGLLTEAGAGWVRRLAVAGPIGAEHFAEVDPLALDAQGLTASTRVGAEPPAKGKRRSKEKNGPPVFRWRTAEDGRLVVAGAAKIGKGGRGEGWLVAAEVWSAGAADVVLKVSVSGAARVFVNGRAAEAVGGVEALKRTLSFLPDDADVPARLEAGWNRILVALERLPEAEVAWRMRVRGVDGMPVGGLVWRGGGEALSGCGWLGASLTLGLAEGEAGWRIRAGLNPGGALPLPWPREVVLRARDGAVLGRAAGWDVIAARAEMEAVMAEAAEVRLEVDGATCLTLALPPEAEARARTVRAARAGVEALTRLDAGARTSLSAVVDELAALLGRSVVGRFGGAETGRVRMGRFEPLKAMLKSRLEAARGGRDPFLAPGFHLRAYASPIDGTPQRYVVAVPRGYQPTKRYPLVVLSHGLHFHAEEMMLSALGERATPRDEDALEAGVSHAAGALWREGAQAAPDGMILVAHGGYGEAGPRPVGRLEVLHVLEDVGRWLSVEPTRVSVTGFSLGGSVAFWAGLHHADLFAAAAPLCGYPNLEGYTNVRRVEKRPWEHQLLNLEGVSAHVPNGRQLPLWMVHGRKDGPSRSEGLASRYRALGYAAKLDIPDAGHDIWDEAYADGAILRWLASRRRNPRPGTVTIAAGRHRTAALDWLRIDRFARWGDMGELDGEVVARGGGKDAGTAARLAATVRVRTRGVEGFTVRVGRLPTGVGAGDALEVDGEALSLASVERDVHVVRGPEGRWELRTEPAATAKKVGVEGPLSEVYLSPYVVIVGTADVRQTEANQLVAERFATPSPAVRLAPRVLTDVAWGDRPLTGTGAILIGGPRSNRVTARLVDGFAARGLVFEDGAIVVGACRHAGEDVGVSAILPNPDDAAFSVVVHAGVGAPGTLGARYLPEILPDFVVYDRGIRVAAGDKLLGPRPVRQAGFFDEDWQLGPGVVACASTK